MINRRGILFIIRNWKLIIHLLLHTRCFGVNNQWSVEFDSLFSGRHRGLRYVVSNYREAKLRATAYGFLARQECVDLGWDSDT